MSSYKSIFFIVIAFIVTMSVSCGPKVDKAALENEPSIIKWQDFDEAAFKQAKEETKLVMVYLNPFWEHRTHIMNDSTFNDSTIAELIMDKFIPVRVDPDKRPEINRRYNVGGWPSIAFVTPEGMAIGGTMFHTPQSFSTNLMQYSELYTSKAETLAMTADSINAFIDAAIESATLPTPGIPEDMVPRLVDKVSQAYDEIYGGVKSDGAKGLEATALLYCFNNIQKGEVKSRLNKIGALTLSNLFASNTWDIIDGGFHSYSLTPNWDSPGYQKMLSDNAAMLLVVANHMNQTQDKLYQKHIDKLVNFLDRLLGHGKGYYNALDSDLGVYWQPEGYLPGSKYYKLSEADRRKNGNPRQQTIMTVDANAMMVSGLLAIGGAAKVDKWSKRGLEVLDFLWDSCYKKGQGMAHYYDDAPKQFSILPAQANMLTALLDAYEFTGNRDYFDKAVELWKDTEELLWDNQVGAFNDIPTKNNPLAFIRKQPYKPEIENGIMARVSERMFYMTGDSTYHTTTGYILARFAQKADFDPIININYLMAAETYNQEPMHIVIVGDYQSPKVAGILAEAHAMDLGWSVIEVIHPQKHTARLEKTGYPPTDKPIAFACVGDACCPPVEDPKDFKTTMNDFFTQLNSEESTGE